MNTTFFKGLLFWICFFLAFALASCGNYSHNCNYSIVNGYDCIGQTAE